MNTKKGVLLAALAKVGCFETMSSHLPRAQPIFLHLVASEAPSKSPIRPVQACTYLRIWGDAGSRHEVLDQLHHRSFAASVSIFLLRHLNVTGISAGQRRDAFRMWSFTIQKSAYCRFEGPDQKGCACWAWCAAACGFTATRSGMKKPHTATSTTSKPRPVAQDEPKLSWHTAMAPSLPGPWIGLRCWSLPHLYIRRPTTPRATTRRPKLPCKMQACGVRSKAATAEALRTVYRRRRERRARDLSSQWGSNSESRLAIPQ